MNFGIIGAGSIGTHLKQRLEEEGHRVAFVLGRNSDSTSLRVELDKNPVDAVFLAISTKDKGKAAFDYIQECMNEDDYDPTPVITCEKGSLAYHSDQLRRYIDRNLLAYSASVGGGTMMVQYLQNRYLAKHPVTIEAVLNGTLNSIFYETAENGHLLEDTAQKMIKKGFAEPGAIDAKSMINLELEDIWRKISILFNTLLSTGSIITPDYFRLPQLTDENLRALSTQAEYYRFIVTFSNHNMNIYGDGEFLGNTFLLENLDGWRIVGGFRKLMPADDEWLPKGVNNAIHLRKGTSGTCKYTLTGNGAGAEATVDAMMADMHRLCRTDD